MRDKSENYIFYMLCFLGIFLKLFFGQTYSQDGSNGPASSTMWGYGLILVCLASFFLINFIKDEDKNKLKSNNNDEETTAIIIITFEKILEFIKEFINYKNNTMSIIFMFFVLLWAFSINFTHYKRINQGLVANDYNFYSTISTILITIQLIVLFRQMTSTANTSPLLKEHNLNENKRYNGMSFLISIINFVFLLISTITLEYFSTDG